MGSPPICEGTLLGFWVFLLFAVSFCYGSADQFEVVGVVECADCSESHIKAIQALSGLGVTIDCKLANGEFKTRAFGEVSNEGKFKVPLPEEMVKDGYQLKEECFAQLHSASATPCPAAQSSPEASKIVLKVKANGKKHGQGRNLLLKSIRACGIDAPYNYNTVSFRSGNADIYYSIKEPTRPLWWPFYKYPPLPKLPLPLPKAYPPPWKKFGHVYKKPVPPSIPINKKPIPPPVHKKLLPPKAFIHKKPLPPKVQIPKKPIPPPLPVYKKPFPPSVPVFKKPIPPPVPVYKRLPPPAAPVYQKRVPPPVRVFKKPCPPPVPIAMKLLPPHVPIYKKPLLPPTPIYNKPNPPPFYKRSIHKPIPPVYKLLPPIPPIPPIYKKPCPPILKPPHYLPKLPPKHFPLPKFEPNPPIQPYFPHP